jgi:hypothetical protein
MKAAAVACVDFASDESLALEPRHQVREAGGTQRDRTRELRHAEPSVGSIGKRDQDVELRDRDAVLGPKSVVERAEDAGGADKDALPGRKLVGA